MIIYLSLLISSFFFSVLEVFTIENTKKYFQYIANTYVFVLFILFSFNRKNNDYEAYVNIFDGITTVKEKGYVFLNYVIKYFGGTYNINLLILGILLIYVLFSVYKIEYKIFFIFLYSIYALIYDINQVRNLYSIMFVLIGLKFLSLKKDMLFILFTALACFFQRVAFIYFLFYLLSKFEIRTYIKAIVISFVLLLCFIIKSQDIMLLVFPDKMVYYLSNNPNHGFVLYYLYFLYDIFLLIYLRKNLDIESVYFKFILFPIIMLPTSYLFLELIGRLWRNSLYIKLFYLLPSLKDRKKRTIIFISLIIEQVLFLGPGFILAPKYTVDFLSQISNICFYF
ncbi:EpsG family protein [Fusobacterium hominis]|uniref:EpsG family protein n=1 Tax=Fusobacterium hominis TaxID=2764326 RepID=UPI003A52229B